jgi:Brp/Blh family beta-carotene 15,15'-monooxygenase
MTARAAWAPSWPLLAGLAAAALAIQTLAPEGARLPLLLAAIVVGGMPHGGLDLLIARRRFPLERPEAVAGFVAAYLALVAVVALTWWAAPTASLLAFLAYSAVHFGGDLPPGRSGLALRAAAGVATLGLPALAHPGTVAALFDALGADGAAAATVLRWTAVPALVVTLGGAAWGAPRALAAWGALGAAAWALHPLGYFLVYFCGVHGPAHMARIGAAFGLDRAALRRGWAVPAAVAGVGVAAAGALLAPRLGAEPALMRATFVGFAALTVPHMLLVDLAAGRRSAAARA